MTRVYTPADLLPLCKTKGVPLVYDVHHHRCNPDGLTVEQATAMAIATWDREPLFHISSPLAGWDGPRPARHHDFIVPEDFPACWRRLCITVEVEAKAKEWRCSSCWMISNRSGGRKYEDLEGECTQQELETFAFIFAGNSKSKCNAAGLVHACQHHGRSASNKGSASAGQKPKCRCFRQPSANANFPDIVPTSRVMSCIVRRKESICWVSPSQAP